MSGEQRKDQNSFRKNLRTIGYRVLGCALIPVGPVAGSLAGRGIVGYAAAVGVSVAAVTIATWPNVKDLWLEKRKDRQVAGKSKRVVDEFSLDYRGLDRGVDLGKEQSREAEGAGGPQYVDPPTIPITPLPPRPADWRGTMGQSNGHDGLE